MGTTISFCIGLALGLFCGASLGYSLRKEFEDDDEFGEFTDVSGAGSSSSGDSGAVEEIGEGSK